MNCTEKKSFRLRMSLTAISSTASNHRVPGISWTAIQNSDKPYLNRIIGCVKTYYHIIDWLSKKLSNLNALQYSVQQRRRMVLHCIAPYCVDFSVHKCHFLVKKRDEKSSYVHHLVKREEKRMTSCSRNRLKHGSGLSECLAHNGL